MKRFLVLNQSKDVRPHAGVQDHPQHLRDKLAQFSSYHLLRNVDVLVYLPIMNREPQSDKTGENGSRSSLRLDDWGSFPWTCSSEIGERDNVGTCAEVSRSIHGELMRRFASGRTECRSLSYLSRRIASAEGVLGALLLQYHGPVGADNGRREVRRQWARTGNGATILTAGGRRRKRI